MPPTPLRGVIAAVVAPIDADGAPDAPRFLRLARHLLGSGCDGLNVLGTTGEATSFSLGQRMRLMEATAEGGLVECGFVVEAHAPWFDTTREQCLVPTDRPLMLTDCVF